MPELSTPATTTQAPIKVLLTVEEAALALSVGRTLMWELVMGRQVKSIKLGRSRRVPMAALQEFVARELEERQAAGAAWADHQLVFTRKDGEPLRGTHVLEREFRPLLQRAGLPPIRLHDLRHTAATLLLLQNVPVKVVSEMP
ncbi:MAG: tyrosine-type recombinase/integrase [Ktedonobacterales bacterium]